MTLALLLAVLSAVPAVSAAAGFACPVGRQPKKLTDAITACVDPATGKKDGPYAITYPDGTRKEDGSYVGGLLDGPVNVYGEDGALRQTLVYHAGNLDPASFTPAQRALNGVAVAQRDRVSRRITELQAQVVVNEWRKTVSASRAGGRYRIDVHDAVVLAGKERHSLPDKRIHYAFGVKTACAKAFGVRGAANTLDRLPKGVPAAERNYADELLAVRGAVKAFFDDPKAVCKDPAKGFELYAVGASGDGADLAVWTADETENIRH